MPLLRRASDISLTDLARLSSRRAGAVTYLGRQSRSDVDVPLEAVEQILRPGQESQLPHGGRRLWMFNAEDGLPMLLITTDHTGHQVEYYCYDRAAVPASPRRLRLQP